MQRFENGRNFGTSGQSFDQIWESFLSNYYKTDVASAGISVRMAFLRKVYGILSAQLLTTTLVCAGFMFNAESVKAALHAAVGTFGLLPIGFLGAVAIGLLFALQWKARETPTNFILLLAFTLCESVTLGVCVVHFQAGIVLQAMVLTLLVTASLTLYSLQSKWDFSCWETALYSGLLLLLGCSVMQIALPTSLMEMGIIFGGALLFSLLIIFDTARIMHKVSSEEYILASVDLYLDIINLFIDLLRILNYLKKE